MKVIHYTENDESLCGSREPGRYLAASWSMVTCGKCLLHYQEECRREAAASGAEFKAFFISESADIPAMPFGTLNPWTYIKAAQFFPAYAPEVKDFRRKMSGKNSNGNPISFTDTDKAAIRAGLSKLSVHLRNAAIGLLLLLTACQKDIPPQPTPEEVIAAPAPKDTLTAVAGPDFAAPGK